MIPLDISRNFVRNLAECAAWQDVPPEPVIEPELQIIDPHQHFWRKPDNDFLPSDYAAEAAASGHRIAGTVFIECGSNHFSDGPAPLRPVGETIATVTDTKGIAGLAAGIIARADLTLGADVGAVLDAHAEAADGRLRGIRHSLRWDASGIGMSGRWGPRHLALNPIFRAGFAELGRRGLAFEAWIFHPQLTELAELASAFPETLIIVNHLGMPLGIGPYAGQRDRVFIEWRDGLAALARQPNVRMKLGGMGMLYWGWEHYAGRRPPGSETLSVEWRPYVETVIEKFGVDRCFFESNWPVDMQTCSFRTLWNAFKLLARGFSADEKQSLFSGSARATYRLEI
ncbi:putative TIM-barrel fold metal-dependent hydrolase [Neorhizobium galegae]|uniref:amidohydrolase family protein n=1 Tax=Neorhizobium galegae TaxID=399 RepID=UPI001AE9E283|nr:amidohydrolase family protein [Neorhizobium galegae]MBP2563172.1 putative TIM-barrel fold metal-dependent hydrolase [Neorhizobium galegae]